MAIVRNLATVKTTADITSSATSIPVNRLNVFGASQTTLDNPFYVTIMPASGDEPANLVNSEIALVTGMSGLNLTVTRGQRDTTAKAFSAGAIVTMGIYAEDAVLNSGVKSGVNNAQTELRDKDGNAIYPKVSDVESSQIADSAVTSAKIGGSAVTTAKIADKNVTTAKIADSAVTTAKIAWSGLLNKIYPVGSIYMSASLSTPSAVATALGGTWVAWGAGRVPVGVDTTQTEFNTVNKTGGEKTHTLTIDEIPSHRHSTTACGTRGKAQSDSSGTSGYAWNADSGSVTGYTGGGGAHNNLQPYITCYMYKRTA